MVGVRALILAAGLGTRLQPLTNYWPKCLMPIRGRPLLEYWLATLSDLNIRDVLVNTHSHEKIVASFLQRECFKNWVRMVYEPFLLGTAGTLRANLDYFSGHTVLMIHGDNWCQCNFHEFLNYHKNYRPSNCVMTMMTFDTLRPQNCGIVETDLNGVVTRFYEKVSDPPGTRANGAVYLIDSEVFEWLELHSEISDFSTEVIPNFIGRIATWHNNNIHRDIGTLAELAIAQSDLHSGTQWDIDDEWLRNFRKSETYSSISRKLTAT